MVIEVTYNVTDVYVSTTTSPVFIDVSFEAPVDINIVWGDIGGTLSNQTDLQNALNLKLDESTIDGGAEGQILSKASATDFDFAWINNYAKYLATNVRNQTGSTIAAFQVVYISGATGNKPLISLADADTEATSSKTYGVTATAIANNGTGDVVTAGELSGIDTSAFTEGDSLWLSTTAGGVVTTPPAEPAHAVFIGTVIRSHPTLGVIDVAIQNGYELNELHGVLITSPANNQGLFYNSGNGLWENKSIATALGYTPEQPLTFGSPLSRVGNVVSIPQATGSVNGFLSATDWTTFNSKQNAIGYTPANAATTLTINGVTYDLSQNRSWTISAGISGTIASGQVAYGTAANTIGGSNNLFWDNTNGRLGIGTNAPPAKLTVWGGDVFIQSQFVISSGTALNSYPSVTNKIKIYDTSNGEMAITMYNTSWWLRHNANMSIAGNLLLGTTSDDGVNRLQVSGNAKVTGKLYTTSDIGTNINLYTKPTFVQDGSIIAFAQNLNTNKGSFSGVVVSDVPGAFGGHFITSSTSANPDWLIGITKNSGTWGDLHYMVNSLAANIIFTLKKSGQVRIVPLASAPASPQAGDVYYDSTLNKLRVYTTAWETITSV